MTKLDIMKKLDDVLPESWRISEIVPESGLVKVVCPMHERCHTQYFEDVISKIEKALNADYDGGGALIGDVEYDNYFYLRKGKKTTKKTNKANKTKKPQAKKGK